MPCHQNAFRKPHFHKVSPLRCNLLSPHPPSFSWSTFRCSWSSKVFWSRDHYSSLYAVRLDSSQHSFACSSVGRLCRVNDHSETSGQFSWNLSGLLWLVCGGLDCFCQCFQRKICCLRETMTHRRHTFCLRHSNRQRKLFDSRSFWP